MPSPAYSFLRMTAMAFAALLLAACDDTPESVTVKASTYGDRWPYPGFDGGVIRCLEPDPYNRPVVIELGGKEYGMNGSSFSRFPDSRQLMAVHPEWGTYELGAMGDLIQLGLGLCSKPKRVSD